MTKTELRSVSPIFAVMEKAIRGVSPPYDSRGKTIDLPSGCPRSACCVIGHARISTVAFGQRGARLPFKPQIEQVVFIRSRDDQPGTGRGYRPLHGLEQIVELLRRRVGRHGRRVHVVGLEQVGKICLALHLPEKLVHPEPALLAHEFDHELDVVLQRMDGRIERAAEYARVPAAIDDEEFRVQALQHFIFSGRGIIIGFIDKFRRQKADALATLQGLLWQFLQTLGTGYQMRLAGVIQEVIAQRNLR